MRCKTGKKVFGAIISLALLTALCLAVSTQVMAAGITWYVDDSNAGAEDGSVAHPYNTIQEAVDAATDDDIIIVAAGTYTEIVTVTKRLTIKADTAAVVTCTPSAGIDFFLISNTDNVTINGFTVNLGQINLDNAHSCTITNNILNSYGIVLYQSNMNLISQNQCLNGFDNGIYLEESNSNSITKNTCDNDTDGIYLYLSNGNTVAGNTCSNNTNGIVISYSNDNIVNCNNLHDNGNIGIYIEDNGNNTVIYNTLNHNDAGFQCGEDDLDASLVYLRYNNITNNRFGAYNAATGTLNATYNYWSGNTTSNTLGDVTTGSDLAGLVTMTYPAVTLVSPVTTTTYSIATETETTTDIATTTIVIADMETVTTTESVTQTETDTTTAFDTRTVTVTQSFTSTDTQTSTSTQSVTSTDTRSLTFTVTVPQTINYTATTTLTITEANIDIPVVIIIGIAGLLAGGLVVAIIIRKM